MLNFFKKSEPATENLTLEQIAEKVIAALGGKDNIEHVDACLTRLRVELKNGKLVDKKGLKAAGAVDTVKITDTNVQVILGQKAASYQQAVTAALTK